jgi:hypothetical protein
MDSRVLGESSYAHKQHAVWSILTAAMLLLRAAQLLAAAAAAAAAHLRRQLVALLSEAGSNGSWRYQPQRLFQYGICVGELCIQTHAHTQPAERLTG